LRNYVYIGETRIRNRDSGGAVEKKVLTAT
jgi:hypothetical protein